MFCALSFQLNLYLECYFTLEWDYFDEKETVKLQKFKRINIQVFGFNRFPAYLIIHFFITAILNMEGHFGKAILFRLLAFVRTEYSTSF